eukprot:GHVU01236110.1.p1 GENE.GHVU01236110.1~~GHVU01236110.1.p1  ORF type:complete len:503 (-),score=62.60 GHVU01236110.1:1929-3359(-)
MLHEAPLHLHRFYSHNSCFVHGGVEKPGEEQPPVMGQADIHKKIMSLNFRDCHAKIRQVDSQATVGSAVVVQVTGELSNNGQPMRRFMQTFVLAPQSPKKYYVHNDIFRYQDEVFHDNDTDTDNQEPVAEIVQKFSVFSDSESEPGDDGRVPSEPAQDQVVTPYFDQGPTPMSNGTAHSEERMESPVEVVEEEPKVEEEPTLQEPIEPPQVPIKSPEPEPEPELQVTEPIKPCSWAQLAAAKGMSGGSVVPAAVQPPMTRPAPVVMKPSEPKTDASGPSPQPQRAPRPPRERTGGLGAGPGGGFRGDREGSRTSFGPPDENRGRMGRYPDSHQLFVGNLPHDVSEPELEEFFGRFGKVIELRINTKSSGGKVPNFGFVVFESPDTVQTILQNKPVKFRDNHRINVEEKKQRGERPGSGNRLGRGGGANMNSMGRGGGGPMGGGRGGRGGGANNTRPDKGPLGGPPHRGGFGGGPRR